MSFILVKNKNNKKDGRRKLKEKEITTQILLNILEIVATLLIIASYLFE